MVAKTINGTPVVGHVVPDYKRAIAIPGVTATGTITYTAPDDGYIFVAGYGPGANGLVFLRTYGGVNNNIASISTANASAASKWISAQLPVKKGTRVSIETNGLSSYLYATFVPMCVN